MKETQYSVTTTSEASEGKFCQVWSHKLSYDYYQYSHIGSFHCTHCSFKTPPLDVQLDDIDLDKENFTYANEAFHSPYEGMYSMYNCTAKFMDYSDKKVVDVMNDFAYVYGEYSEYYDDYKWQTLSTCADYYDFDWKTTGTHSPDSLGDCLATLHCYKQLYKLNNQK